MSVNNRRQTADAPVRDDRASLPTDIEPLERRVLLSASIDNGTLIVFGTAGADSITISPSGATQVIVDIGGVQQTFARADFTALLVDGLGGNDLIEMTGTVTGNRLATLQGGDGDDTLVGSTAAERLNGGNGNDVLRDGGGAEDTLVGGAGSRDVVDYGTRTEALVVTLDGVADDGGDDEKDNVGADIEWVYTGSGNDLIVGNDAANYVFAGGGSDIIHGHGGNDTLSGGAQRDLIYGGTGRDRVNGNGGHDYLLGEADDDRLYGGDGNDVIGGGANVDRAWGGAGDDYITGLNGNDKLYGQGGLNTLIGGDGDDYLNATGGRSLAYGQDGNDRILARNGLVDSVHGGAGTDEAQVDDGTDVLTGIETLLA